MADRAKHDKLDFKAHVHAPDSPVLKADGDLDAAVAELERLKAACGPGLPPVATNSLGLWK